ncbi:MAG: hypothetical protein IJ220_08050 [Clostridia bacterium]|nr:hypothetical protein [Clostridia bacterium]
MEEWVSLQEFMRRKKVGKEVAFQLLATGKYEYEKTEGGHYKIKLGGDTISKEAYEKEKERRIQAETKLEMLKKILNEGVNTNEIY